MKVNTGIQVNKSSLGELTADKQTTKSTTSFADSIKSKNDSIPPRSELVSYLHKFQSDWTKAQNKRNRVIDKVPKDYKNFVETQVLVSEMALKSQMVSKVGEGVSATVRKVQSFGS